MATTLGPCPGKKKQSSLRVPSTVRCVAGSRAGRPERPRELCPSLLHRRLAQSPSHSVPQPDPTPSLTIAPFPFSLLTNHWKLGEAEGAPAAAIANFAEAPPHKYHTISDNELFSHHHTSDQTSSLDQCSGSTWSAFVLAAVVCHLFCCPCHYSLVVFVLAASLPLPDTLALVDTLHWPRLNKLAKDIMLHHPFT